MTGADDGTNPSQLFELSAKYPFVEWGILLSRNSMGRKRFPSLKWLDMLHELHSHGWDCKFSGHLCGAWVNEFLLGNLKMKEELGMVWDLFHRIQINTHGERTIYDSKGLAAAVRHNPKKEFIFQFDNVNTDILKSVNSTEDNISALFDVSHGAGVLPETWPTPLFGIKCGYAGGLSPENVAQQIGDINFMVNGDTDIWIDAETHLRSDNDKLFDLNKVESFLKACEPYIFKQ